MIYPVDSAKYYHSPLIIWGQNSLVEHSGTDKIWYPTPLIGQ